MAERQQIRDGESGSGFAERLRMARQRVGTSQNQLAREVGVDPSYLNRIERGEREAPRREVVEALADALGLAPAEADELLVAAGHLTRALAQLGPLDPTIRLVAEALADQSIPEDDRAALRQCLDLIVPRFGALRAYETIPNSVT